MIVLLLRRKPVVFYRTKNQTKLRVNYCPPFALRLSDLKKIVNDKHIQKWNPQNSASDDGVKIEFRPVLAQFRANLSFPALKMLLSDL